MRANRVGLNEGWYWAEGGLESWDYIGYYPEKAHLDGVNTMWDWYSSCLQPNHIRKPIRSDPHMAVVGDDPIQTPTTKNVARKIKADGRKATADTETANTDDRAV